MARHRGSDTQDDPLERYHTQNSLERDRENRKAFRIKVRGASFLDEMSASIKSNRQLDSRRETFYVAPEKKTMGGTETNSFVEQIRRKFSDHKYMKREDVLKMLKQMQASD